VPAISFDDAWLAYRAQMFGALAWWTGTLGQPPEAPAMQPRAASLTFIDVGDRVNFGASARMRAFIEGARPVARVEDLVRQALAVSPGTDPDLMLYRYQSLLVRRSDGFGWKADRRIPVDFPHILERLAELSGLAPRISCPVLVAKGARSRVLSPAGVERFAKGFPRGRWTVIPGAGHNIQEDQPVALAAAISELLLKRDDAAARPPGAIHQTNHEEET